MPLRYPTTSISNDIYGASDYDLKCNSKKLKLENESDFDPYLGWIPENPGMEPTFTGFENNPSKTSFRKHLWRSCKNC